MILEIDTTQAILHTTPTPEVLAMISGLEGPRTWLNRATKLRVQNTKHNIDQLRSLPNVVVQDNSARPKQLISVGPRPTFAFKTEPYDHQRKALGKIDSKHAFALFMEQGTGKTKTLLDWAAMLYCAGLIDAMIIVSKKGVHRQWVESEIPTHLAIPSECAFWPYKKAPKSTAALNVVAINYDAVKSGKGQKAIFEFAGLFAGRLLIIADESQDIKNAMSQRHKAMMILKNASSYRALATGTPIAKDLTDEWAQLKWLNESIIGIRYVTAFRREYCIMGGFEGRQVIGHRNLERFKKLTEPHIFRATKADIGILPKQYATWNFDLLPEQIKAIRQLKSELELTLSTDSTITAANAAVAFAKFQQIASGFVLDRDNLKCHTLIPNDKNPRLLALKEWIDAHDGKFIVWARFRQELRIIAETLTDIGISFAEYHGGTDDKERARAVASFKSASGVQALVANAQSAGTGLNLQDHCNGALYFSNSFASIDRWQSEDRIHRIGQRLPVTYTDLVAKGSIDGYILRNLRKKKGLSDLVLDDFKNLLEEL